MKTINQTDYKGHVNKVLANENGVFLEYWYRGSLQYDGFEYTREEALAAAHAIIAYYEGK